MLPGVFTLMPIDMKAVDSYVKGKYPDKEFSPSQRARIWLQEVKGEKVNGGVKDKVVKPVNGKPIVKACPTCEKVMVNFPLCGGCEAARKLKAKSVWICPSSKGLNAHVNLDENNPKLYRDYFIIGGVGYSKVDCKQEPILEMGGFL
ncbi:MAG TPA: hypothetical protein ENI76_02865 [Ignavibacteria bacterium]|nr:hypothetical protein [Ignavibacteria bacterium]